MGFNAFSDEYLATVYAVAALMRDVTDKIQGLLFSNDGETIAVALVFDTETAEYYEPLITLARVMFPLWDDVMSSCLQSVFPEAFLAHTLLGV